MGCRLFRPGMIVRGFFAGLLLAAGVAPIAAGQGAQDAADIRLEISILTEYAQRPELRTSNLEAFVQARRAVLSGRVDDEGSRRLAASIAMGVAGIISVDNRITGVQSLPQVPIIRAKVEAESKNPWQAPVNDGRCRAFATEFGLAADDIWITTKVMLALVPVGDVSGSAIAVSTCDGVVTLRGTLHNDAERARAVMLARGVPGARAVRAQALNSEICGGMHGRASTQWPWVAIVCLPTARNGASAG